MNSTIVNSTTYSKVKKLSLQIENLRGVRNVFGLTLKQQLKLELKEAKLCKLIKTL